MSAWFWRRSEAGSRDGESRGQEPSPEGTAETLNQADQEARASAAALACTVAFEVSLREQESAGLSLTDLRQDVNPAQPLAVLVDIGIGDFPRPRTADRSDHVAELATSGTVNEQIGVLRAKHPDSLLVLWLPNAEGTRLSPVDAVTAGADVVLTTPVDGVTTVRLVRGRPVVRLGALLPEEVSAVGGGSLEWDVRLTAAARMQNRVELQLRPWVRGVNGSRPLSLTEIAEVYASALCRTTASEAFLENIDVISEPDGTSLIISLNRSGRLARDAMDNAFVSPPWNEGASHTLEADPARLSTSLVMEYELNRRSVAFQAITRNLLVSEPGESPFCYYLSSSHRSPYTAVRTVGDKDAARSMLASVGLPVARGQVFRDRVQFEPGLELLNSLGMVVVKPVDGAQGKGVSIGVASADEFREAWEKAFDASESGVLVEKYFSGAEARFAVVGDRCVAVTRRRPPKIVGDGVRRIRDIVVDLNRSRRSNPHLVNRPLVLDATRVARLKEHGLTPLSILPPGDSFDIDPNAGYYAGAETEDITDDTHASYKDAAVRAVRAVPGLSVAGLDVIMADYAAPAGADNFVVLEVNSQPGLGLHHFPVHGKARNVAGAIIDHDRSDRDASAFIKPPEQLSSTTPSPPQVVDPSTRLMSTEFERIGFSIEWVGSDCFHAERDSTVTAIWRTYTALSGKSAVIATRYPRAVRQLLEKNDLQVPDRWRLFPRDAASGALANGEKARAYARDLTSPALQGADGTPVPIDPTDEESFATVWRAMARRSRRGIVVYQMPPGQIFRLLVAYGTVLLVVPATGTNAAVIQPVGLGVGYEDSARRACAAFPGLDIAEVRLSVADPTEPASAVNHAVISVRPGPSIEGFQRAGEQAGVNVAREIVARHVANLPN